MNVMVRVRLRPGTKMSGCLLMCYLNVRIHAHRVVLVISRQIVQLLVWLSSNWEYLTEGKRLQCWARGTRTMSTFIIICNTLELRRCTIFSISTFLLTILHVKVRQTDTVCFYCWLQIQYQHIYFRKDYFPLSFLLPSTKILKKKRAKVQEWPHYKFATFLGNICWWLQT